MVDARFQNNQSTENTNKNLTLVAIAGTTKLIPYDLVKIVNL